jgi:hypothetical protein
MEDIVEYDDIKLIARFKRWDSIIEYPDFPEELDTP